MSAATHPTIHVHLDVVDRHVGSTALSCVTGWIAAEPGDEIMALGLRLDDGSYVRCHYPFHRGDVQDPVVDARAGARVGFSVLLPVRLVLTSRQLTFAAALAAGDSWHAFALEARRGASATVGPGTGLRPTEAPFFTEPAPDEIGPLLEARLLDSFARERHLTLRLDLINKCNLRCVMCHYSNESIAKRPAQRIEPGQFAAYFDPIAPLTRDVVLSCGDEPLMSPHFETIIRELAARDPEVRIIFCTNAMLLSEKLAAAIVETKVHLVMFSFDGVTSGTLHRIRVGSDFRRIVRNIVGLKRARARAGQAGPRFVFNYVMLESNIHEAPLFVRLARELGGEAIDFRHVVPMDTYDIAHEMLEKRPAKYNYYREQIIAAAAECGLDIYIPPALPVAGGYDPAADPVVGLEEFHEVLRGQIDDNVDAVSLPRPSEATRRDAASTFEAVPERVSETAHCFCDRPFREVMIREQRDVYPCAWHEVKMGTLDGTTTLEEIFLGENFRKLRLAMLDPLGAPGCRHCPIKANQLPTHLLPSGSRPPPAEHAGAVA